MEVGRPENCLTVARGDTCNWSRVWCYRLRYYKRPDQRVARGSETWDHKAGTKAFLIKIIPAIVFECDITSLRYHKRPNHFSTKKRKDLGIIAFAQLNDTFNGLFSLSFTAVSTMAVSSVRLAQAHKCFHGSRAVVLHTYSACF